jgi:hypothetical protein
VSPPKKFAGKEEGLGDEFVYQHTDGRDATDQFTNSTEEIIRYSSTKYKNGADVGRSLADGAKLTIELPAAPVPAGTPPAVPEAQMVIWKMKLQLSLQRGLLLDSNLESAYTLIKDNAVNRSWKRSRASRPIVPFTKTATRLGCLDESRV